MTEGLTAGDIMDLCALGVKMQAEEAKAQGKATGQGVQLRHLQAVLSTKQLVPSLSHSQAIQYLKWKAALASLS